MMADLEAGAVRSDDATAPQSVQRSIGKKELAAALGWSRPKLDRRLKTDPLFPILRQGTQRGGWEFDLASVLDHLENTSAPWRETDAGHSVGLGKRDLAALLNWSRPTLDRRLANDPIFPVVTRGAREGGWTFDIAAVRKYLGANAAPGRQPPANRHTYAVRLLQASLPAEFAGHVLGKKELAAALGWSLYRLNGRLRADPAFPVLRRGENGGWAFDLCAVRDYLAGVTTSASV